MYTSKYGMSKHRVCIYTTWQTSVLEEEKPEKIGTGTNKGSPHEDQSKPSE